MSYLIIKHFSPELCLETDVSNHSRHVGKISIERNIYFFMRRTNSTSFSMYKLTLSPNLHITCSLDLSYNKYQVSLCTLNTHFVHPTGRWVEDYQRTDLKDDGMKTHSQLTPTAEHCSGSVWPDDIVLPLWATKLIWSEIFQLSFTLSGFSDALKYYNWKYIWQTIPKWQQSKKYKYWHWQNIDSWGSSLIQLVV